MKIDAKLMHLVGALVLVAMLGLGAVHLVLPVYYGVQAAENDIVAARAQNEATQAQLIRLVEAEAREQEIEQVVAHLREQIPATRRDDTVLQVVATAISASGAFIDAETFTEPTDFSARTDAYGDQQQLGGEIPPPPPMSDEFDTDPAPNEATVAAGGGDAFALAEPGAGQDSGGAPGRKQLDVSLTLSVRDLAMATTLLEALRQGPRAMLVTHASFEQVSAHELTGWEYELQVHAVTFFYEGELMQSEEQP